VVADRAGAGANAAARSKGTYLAAQYARIKGRRGHKKAIVAVAHSILVICWHLLTRNAPYSDLGGDYFLERQSNDVSKSRLVRQLERMATRSTCNRPMPPDRALTPGYTSASARDFQPSTVVDAVAPVAVLVCVLDAAAGGGLNVTWRTADHDPLVYAWHGQTGHDRSNQDPLRRPLAAWGPEMAAEVRRRLEGGL
jgi:hypothetical protein